MRLLDDFPIEIACEKLAKVSEITFPCMICESTCYLAGSRKNKENCSADHEEKCNPSSQVNHHSAFRSYQKKIGCGSQKEVKKRAVMWPSHLPYATLSVVQYVLQFYPIEDYK